MADPRTATAARTVNEQLADAIILHMTQVERVKEALAAALGRELSKDLDRMVRKIRTDLERIASRGYGAMSQKNFRRILERLGESSADAISRMRSVLEAELDDLAAYERTWMVDRLKAIVPAVGISITSPTAESLRGIKSKRPFNGKHLRTWFKQLDANTRSRVAGAVREGIANGEPTRQIVQRLTGTRAAGFTDGVIQATKREATTIVQTAVQHTTQQVREDVYKANADIVSQVQWVATLDLVTCPTCASLDGRTWPNGVGERPPAHPNCRCVGTPVLVAIGDTGLKLSDINPGLRASMDGAVPGNLSFGEWLRTRSVREQNVVLGPQRAALFREGKLGDLDPRKMLGANRRPIPVRELRKRGL